MHRLISKIRLLATHLHWQSVLLADFGKSLIHLLFQIKVEIGKYVYYMKYVEMAKI